MTPAPAPQSRLLVERYALPPKEIERRSLALVDAALQGRFAEEERPVAGRIVYAAGDLALLDSICFSAGAVAAGVVALRGGCRVVTDVRMVAAGLDRVRLERLNCPILCEIDAPAVAARARTSGLPRAVEAIRSLEASLGGAVIVIGNAPTALLALLDLVDTATIRPALIVGMPVGFVAAAEAKQELIDRAVPFITVVGTRGGSPLAAAALNALARMALADAAGMA